MNPKPRVSVITLFHQDTPYLRPALRSVLAQTFQDFELLLVDNGTGLLSEQLGPEAEDPRVRFVRLPRNEGIPGGHNAGVQAARGEYIALFDYDDLMLPMRLGRQVATLDSDPGLLLVSGVAERIDAEERVLGREFSIVDPAQAYAYSAYAAPFPTPACVGRRALFTSLPYRTEFPFASDFDFQARAAEHGRVEALPEVVLKYRWYPSQTTQEKSAQIERSRVAARILAARRRAGRPEALERLLSHRLCSARTAAECCQLGAWLALSEGYTVLAAYLARRMVVYEKRGGSALGSARLAVAIWRATRGPERDVCAAMYLRGPVRALRITRVAR